MQLNSIEITNVSLNELWVPIKLFFFIFLQLFWWETFFIFEGFCLYALSLFQLFVKKYKQTKKTICIFFKNHLIVLSL